MNPLAINTPLTKLLRIDYPIICGAMYPCSNPKLIAAVSRSGGIGIVQPLSLEYVFGYDIEEGLNKIKALTDKPFGMNIIVEASSSHYQKRMKRCVDAGLAAGCRLFITALGNPQWVIDAVKPQGGLVFHDVTERKWAEKVIDKGVDALICVNNRAGGHAGTKSAFALYQELKDLPLPLICAGGVGNEVAFLEALRIGYQGVQMGTRFIATSECREKKAYKQAIVQAKSADIVLTEKVTGVPLSVIKTEYVEQVGTKAGLFAKWLLSHRLTKHWMRFLYTLFSIRHFKQATLKGGSPKDYWQAGKSVDGIDSIESVEAIIKRFVSYYHRKKKG